MSTTKITGPSVVPQPGDSNYKLPEHFEGAVYYTAVQAGEGSDLLAHDKDFNEIPAPEGYYFQQWDRAKDEAVDGYFGPYDSYEDMPDYVRANFADDFLQPGFHTVSDERMEEIRKEVEQIRTGSKS